MTPPHGTLARYRRRPDPCRCSKCRAAARRNAKLRVFNRARGRATMVDATPVREHIERLRAAGIGLRTLATRTEVSHSALFCIVSGRTRNVRRHVALAVLGVAPDPDARSAGAVAPALATTRRLRALAVRGWSLVELAERSGLERDLLSMLRLGKYAGVTRSTEVAVEALYRDLWDAAPPQGTRQEKSAYSRTRGLAARHGWAPPMAWDDETIGDPDARPAHRLASPSVTHLLAQHPDAPDELLADAAGVQLDSVVTARRRLAERAAS